MTFSQALCSKGYLETWKCDRFFNPRENIGVKVIGRRRYRYDKKEFTSVERLRADGFKLEYRTSQTY